VSSYSSGSYGILPPMTPAQMAILHHPAKRKVITTGRRFGKTALGAIACHEKAAQGKDAWWVARTYKVGEAGWDYIRDLAIDIKKKYVPDLRILDSEPYQIIYPNGGKIQVRAVGDNPNDLRGQGLSLVIFDEAAFMPTLKTAWKAVGPSLLDNRGEAWFISSPFGKNYFHELFQRGNPKSLSYKRGWQSFHFTTYDNPTLTKSDIDDLLEDMDDENDYKEEILAQFVDGAGLVFRRVRERANDNLRRLSAQGPIRGHIYKMGVDWGRFKDETVIMVMDAMTQEIVDIESFTKISFPYQSRRLVAAYHKWKPAIIWAEKNSFGISNIEYLIEKGLPMKPFDTNRATKGPLIEDLVLAIEQGYITYPHDRKLMEQLEAYEQHPFADGTGYKYGAPEGMHDDYVMALALAYHGNQAATGEAHIAQADEVWEDLWGVMS
jgi:phage FluMu gp28-like protein